MRSSTSVVCIRLRAAVIDALVCKPTSSICRQGYHPFACKQIDPLARKRKPQTEHVELANAFMGLWRLIGCLHPFARKRMIGWLANGSIRSYANVYSSCANRSICLCANGSGALFSSQFTVSELVSNASPTTGGPLPHKRAACSCPPSRAGVLILLAAVNLNAGAELKAKPPWLLMGLPASRPGGAALLHSSCLRGCARGRVVRPALAGGR